MAKKPAWPITERQKTVLAFIAKFLKSNKYAPTFREIAAGVGIRTTNGVRCHLVALQKKGYLKYGVAKGHIVTRTMRVVE